MTYCTDVDLLHWEPNLFRDAVFGSQMLLSGSGDLAGTAFTISAGSLADAHVSADQVITLTGAIAGSYPIVSIDSATQLTLSVLYEGLYPDVGAGVPSPAGSAVGLGFAIRTFYAQRKVVSDMLAMAAGIGPETDAPLEARIINTDALRRPSVLGTLQMIYSALAAAAAEPAALSVRAELYERLYRRAMRQVYVEIDLNGDGEADAVRKLWMVRMQRA